MSPHPDPDAAPDADLETALVRSRVLEFAPEALIQRVIDGFAGSARRPGPAPASVLRRLVATLGFDSALATPQAQGVRSSAVASRQLVFTADGRDIDLRITPGPDGRSFTVAGQVFGPETEGRASLDSGGRRSEVAWNEWSEFQFDGVPAGSFTLALRTAEWELELADLQVP